MHRTLKNWFMLSVCILLVFSATPFKIDQNKNQNRSIKKVRILGNEGGKYAKTLAKFLVRELFRIRDIRRNVLPKFIEICMETPCWQSSGWAPTWRTETDRNICYRVLLQKNVNSFFEELINIKVILFLIHELFRQQNFRK